MINFMSCLLISFLYDPAFICICCAAASWCFSIKYIGFAIQINNNVHSLFSLLLFEQYYERMRLQKASYVFVKIDMELDEI